MRPKDITQTQPADQSLLLAPRSGRSLSFRLPQPVDLSQCVYLGLDFTIIGEAPLLDLGEDQLTVDAEFEASPVGRNQHEGCDIFLVLYENFFRQTDGSRLVASGGTVNQFQSHGKPPVGVDYLRIL